MKTIVLPAECDRNAVALLAPDIADALASGPVLLDGTAVVRLGQCAIQLLVSADLTAAARHNRLAVRTSPAMAEMLAIAGLDGRFGAEVAA